ncbi:hypothetical protein [Microcoleus sp. CAWBG58]|uniref:hypothetical protein n=1 Tax=Microcoleus sp. CAWBG58 TaxID=2841651 RepID=UPI0025DBE6B0|nr:hypothetical protein [Microcoleus sp. CAWBG58]
MSNFKKFPTSVRYLIARFRHWTQPSVWAPLAVLCAGGFFIWEVSVHPEKLSIDGEEEAANSNNPDALPGLSAEDSAIAAEIDSLPVLVNQFNRSNSELNLLNSSAVKGKGLFDEIRSRGSEKPNRSSEPKSAAINTFVSLSNLQNPAIGTVNNNSQDSSLPSSNPTSDLSLSGIKTIDSESAGVPEATLPEASGSGTSSKQNDNPLPLSPLQAAMKKYVAADISATAAAVKSANTPKLLDRPASLGSGTNPANLLPTLATAQGKANPGNVPATISPLPASTNTIISDSQQFLNPAATLPESFTGLNSKGSVIPTITPQAPTVALPKNPYQTNLSESGLAPEVQPVALPVATPSPIPLIPNFGQSPSTSAGANKIINPQFSPNSANSQFQQPQPSQINLPSQPNFGSVPQNTNQGGQLMQPQPFSTPRSLTPGRYIGGGEINTFANP